MSTNAQKTIKRSSTDSEEERGDPEGGALGEALGVQQEVQDEAAVDDFLEERRLCWGWG